MKITGILETCIYAEDLAAAEAFYGLLPGLEPVSKEPGRHLFYRCGESMLLIFNPAHTSSEQTYVKVQNIPLHGSKGPGHLAFSIEGKDVEEWKEFLKKKSISIESEITWPNGSVSIYFRDPAGKSLEIVSPDIWKNT